MSFNKDLPHTYEVFGVPGVKWEQGKHLYGPTGDIVVIKDGRGVPADTVMSEVIAPVVEGVRNEAELREFARINGVDGWKTKSIAQLRKEVGG